MRVEVGYRAVNAFRIVGVANAGTVATKTARVAMERRTLREGD
jgi:hypothetical protein